MTREEHMTLYHEHYDKATAALREFVETPGATRWDLWDTYKAENRLAAKHFGVARAMWTREFNRLLKTINAE